MLQVWRRILFKNPVVLAAPAKVSGETATRAFLGFAIETLNAQETQQLHALATSLGATTNTFTYTGPAGLPVFLDALTNSSPVYIEMIGPANETVFSTGGSADAGPYVLPRSGSYTVNVIAYSDGARVARACRPARALPSIALESQALGGGVVP